MLLPPPSAPHSAAHRFSAPAGLRSLLLPPDGVVTRAAAARCCRRSGGGGEDVLAVDASGAGTSVVGHCDEGTKNAKDDEEEEEEDVERAAAKENEAGIMIVSAEEDEELDGFWVSYGRRRGRRRLPPPIPSLVARGALRRTRTGDGRLVIRIVPVVRPECVRARRRGGGGDRLTMRLVEREDGSPIMVPPLREPPGGARQDGSVDGIAREGGDTATLAGGDGGVDDVEGAVAAPEPEAVVPAVPPPRVSSVGCFEDVFRFDHIGTGSLHQMPSLRMVH